MLAGKQISTAVVAGQPLFCIGAGVAVWHVEQHRQPKPVGRVYQLFEVVWRAVARGWCKVAAHLIAKRAVQRMLQNTHELHSRVAARLDAWQDVAAKIGIAAHAVALMRKRWLRHAHMGLVYSRKHRTRWPLVHKTVGRLR